MDPLPIEPALPAIVEALRQHGCVVVEAPPGAGKTTRVPAALAEQIAADQQVVVLEPRRMAARLAAVRVATEAGEAVGGRIGYQVRFENVCGPKTRVRFVTEGVLVRQLGTDPTLAQVGVVVLDEFHERHLHGDLVLSVARELRRSARPRLGIVVMSATLDAAPIARFLDDCPTIRVEGRRFEVQIEHLDKPAPEPLGLRVAHGLRRLVRDGLEGDVLVFLPGAAEIRDAYGSCEPVARQAGLELVTLHGQMPASEQDRALGRSARPKVILSTNVAETSVTIEGVVGVIDSGLARIAGHAPWSGLPTLRVGPISKSSAIQRAGRAGRTRPGRCLRLYTRHDFDQRADHDVPEIQRLDLAETLLTLANLGVTAPAAYPWFDPPPAASLDAAVRLLRALGATDADGRLTGTGAEMARWPVHPRSARLLVEAERRGAFLEACDLAALLGERDLDLSRRASPARAESARLDSRGGSDLTSALLRIDEARSARFDASTLRSLGIDPGAARAIDRTSRHLARLGRRGRATPLAPDLDATLRLCLLSAYPDRVARRVRGDELGLAGGGSARLSPASEVKDAAFLVAVDAEERSDGRGRRTVVRLASAIEPDWLLELFSSEVRESTQSLWNESLERVEVVERLLYQNLVLDESKGARPPAAEAARILGAEAERRGPAAFAPEGALERLLVRVAFVRGAVPDTALRALDEHDAREVVRGLCERCSSLEELRRAGLVEVLLDGLDAEERRVLEASAPERITLPSGRSLAVQYERGRPPWVESRLQDFFGMQTGPTVARGRVSLVLHLLAPNRRAVQVTSDLAGFWERTYAAVRKELCRKYPKHDWPLDGRGARPPPPGRLRAR